MNEFNSENLKQYLESDYPLLGRFKAAAPGTFRHCQNVSTLAEAIAADLGLDQTFMKVCAMYHDIGKIINPHYFTENQEEENPHDNLEPHISYQILTRHVSDSVMILLTQTDMPREVLQVIAKHHGDSPLMAICNKTESKAIDKFRYKCPKPDCEYSSILMITDAVEATSCGRADRMLEPITRTDVVRETIERLRDDKQLDQMRVGILRQVQLKLVRELDGIYHTRIDYDKQSKKK